MSTTDDTTTTDASVPDAVDPDRVRLDRERYGEYRSLMRLSIENEAAACDSVADVRDAIVRENYRTNPRDWVISELRAREEDLRDGE